MRGDITKIDASEVPDHDVLVAGFPCQAFSIAGQRKGFEDTRGTLFFDVVRIASAKLPQILLLENVKGLLNHDKGRSFRVMVDILEDIGYRIYTKVLNTADFGIPHSRERLFIVALRVDTDDEFVFPEPIALNTRLCVLLDEFVGEKYYLSLTARERLFRIEERAAKNNLGYKSVEAKIYVDDYGNLYERTPQLFLNLDANFFKGPDGKRTTLHFTDFTNALYPHVSSLRMPTPLECWRLQGFSDEAHNTVAAAGISDSQRYKQAGNAVSVPVISAIGKRLIPLLSKTNVQEAV